jgi:hypothetical protein
MKPILKSKDSGSILLIFVILGAVLSIFVGKIKISDRKNIKVEQTNS